MCKKKYIISFLVSLVFSHLLDDAVGPLDRSIEFSIPQSRQSVLTGFTRFNRRIRLYAGADTRANVSLVSKALKINETLTIGPNQVIIKNVRGSIRGFDISTDYDNLCLIVKYMDIFPVVIIHIIGAVIITIKTGFWFHIFPPYLAVLCQVFCCPDRVITNLLLALAVLRSEWSVYFQVFRVAFL